MTYSPGFILCSASSGSTLLSHLLDKHPDIACGPELYAFNKPQIYSDYKKFQKRLPNWLEQGLVGNGQISTPGFFLNRKAYFTNKKEIIDMSKQVSSLKAFFDLFFKTYLQRRTKKVWIEKSGSNAYYMQNILNLYPDAKIIHITRDGRDATCSIVSRGGSAYHAISHWLYNVVAALTWRSYNNYLEIRYEDLVAQPNVTLNQVFNHLGVDAYEHKSTREHTSYWQGFSEGNVHSSWLNSPADNISNRSVGRFHSDMSPDLERLFWRVRLTTLGRKRLKAKYSSVSDVMKTLNYVEEKHIEAGSLSVANYIDALECYKRRAGINLKHNRSPWLPLTYLC